MTLKQKEEIRNRNKQTKKKMADFKMQLKLVVFIMRLRKCILKFKDQKNFIMTLKGDHGWRFFITITLKLIIIIIIIRKKTLGKVNIINTD